MTSPTPPDPSIRAAAAQWIARLHDAPASKRTQAALDRWLDADPAHRCAYEEAARMWRDMAGLGSVAPDRLRAARDAALAVRQRRARRRTLLGAGAAACVALSLAWIDRTPHTDDSSPAPIEWRTARGEHRSIALPDGSRLDLDADSHVQVRYAARVRELRVLRGQAAFAVAPGDPRPFEVQAGTGRIHDIGTEFSVQLDAQRVLVAVRDGSVELRARDDAATQRLVRGERMGFAADGRYTARERIDADAAFAWREGRLVFRSEPLQSVLDTLARRHDAAITASNPHVAALRVSGSFPADDLRLALDTIGATLPVRIVKLGPRDWRIDD